MSDFQTIGESNGIAVSDADVVALADEAAAGFDVARLRRSGGRPRMGEDPAEVVPVRIDPKLRAAVAARAAVDHTTASDVIRQALRQYLNVA